MALTAAFGAKVRRVEDPRMITGHATYVDDLRLPNALYMAILRSPYAHARIRKIDATKALQLEGVIGAITGEEVRQAMEHLALGWDGSALGSKVPRRYPLAVEKVRYVGEPVVALIAEGRYLAEDALESIEVDYEPLPVVVDPEKAKSKDAPLLHEELGSNVMWHIEMQQGDVEKAFSEADLIVRERMTNQRLIPMAIEPRAVLADYNEGTKGLTLWSTTQIPHLLRRYLSITLRMPENRIRVIAPDVGGGFGSKLNFYPEEALACYAAMKLGRPIKWTEDRRENMQGTIHGRAYICHVEGAFKKDGRLLGIRCKVDYNAGAYYMHLTPVLPHLTGLMLSGCYKLPSFRYEADVILTNTMSTDAYRGAARPEAIYIVERLMDLAASELGIDPAEIRLRNFIQPNEFPYKTITGLLYDSGDYPSALKKALQLAQYEQFREEQKKARELGRYLGIGISSYVEICGWGPSALVGAVYPGGSAPIGKWEYGAIRFDPSGKVTVETGSHTHGQGNETTWAQIVASELGVPLEDVVVLHGDTAQVPYGTNTYASRSAAVGGIAIYMAAKKLKEKAKRIAARLLETRPEDVLFEAGRFYVEGAPEKSVTIQEVAQASFSAEKLPEGEEPGLEASHFYDPPNFTYPFGTVVVKVEVDPESGLVKLLDYVSVDDCGHVINPLIVEGQVHGGAAQAIAQALYEEAVYDENGQLLTSTLTDYWVPTAKEIPDLRCDRTVTPSPANPLGIKGIGEATTIGTTPAVINAVMDALRPLGIRHLDMPLKPEKVWKAIQEARRGAKVK